VAVRIRERRLVAHRGRVEEGQVGGPPALHQSAVLQAELGRGHAGHLVDRGLPREQALLAAVDAEHTREGPVAPRVGLAGMRAGARVQRQRVRAHHVVGVAERGAHILLALREDHHGDPGALLHHEIHHGLGRLLAGAPGQLRDVDAGQLGLRAGGDHDLVPAHAARAGSPALAVHQAVADRTLPRLRIGEALEQLRDAAVVHPRREEVVHLGAARRIRIDVAGHVHPAGAGAVDHAEETVHLAPVLAARGLHVGDLHGHAAPLADRDRLLGRLLEGGRLAPDVGEVEPAPARHAAGEPDQLVGVAVDARRVHEPGGEAEGPRVERLREQALHALLLLRRHRARGGPDRGQPQGPVAHELHDVHGGAERPQVIEVLAERVPGDRDLAADAARPLLHQIRAARGDRGGREAAHADHLGGHPLAHLGLG